MYHNHSELKAKMVGRFNRTLMTRIQKYFDYSKHNRYFDVLNDIVESYNSSVHRITKFAPKHVREDNQIDVWLNSYNDLLTKTWRKTGTLSINDKVRVRRSKHVFEKGYSATFSNEIFVIKDVIMSKPITCKLKIKNEKDVLGVCYEFELSKVNVETQ